MLSDENNIIDVNQALISTLGYSKDEVIGKSGYDLDFFVDPEKAAIVTQKLIRDRNFKNIELKIRTKDGKILYGLFSGVLIKDKDKELFLTAMVDITQIKDLQKNLESSLKEKETLLREIHHRVNNNMQIISSILNLQTGHVEEEETIDKLKSSQNRVMSMAIVHEKLYRSKDLSHINFKQYVEELVSDVLLSYHAHEIESLVDVEDIKLNMETAIPLGLIINELVNNSLKFAFPEKKGTISIEMKPEKNRYVLKIADNGIGLPENFYLEKTKSLGLQLVRTLVNQIDGAIELDRSYGTSFTITFKELDYKKRI
jgi:PAS domain S-box-containing protein